MKEVTWRCSGSSGLGIFKTWMTKPQATSSECSPHAEVTLLPAAGWAGDLSRSFPQSASTIHFHLHLLQLWFIFLKYARLELYTAFQRKSSRIYEAIINLPKSIANASPFSARRPQLPRVCISVTLQYSSPVQTIPWHRTSNLHYTTLTTRYVQNILMLMQLILLLLIQPLR